MTIALASCSVGCDALFGLDSLKTPGIDAQYLDARVDAGVLPDATCVPTMTTTTLLGARSGGLGQASMADTYIADQMIPTNFGASPTLALCNACTDPGTPWDGGHTVILLWFDTSSICPSSTLVSADLLLDTTDNLGDGEVGVFLMLEEWTEGDGPASGTVGASNWAQAKPGVLWKNMGASPPGSRDAATLATFSPTAKNTPYEIALPAATLQRWLTTPSSNHGLAVLITTSNSDAQFHSRESASVAQRPGLRVTTRVNPP